MLRFFSQESTKSYRRITFLYQKVRDSHFLCHLIWSRWFNFLVYDLSVLIWLDVASGFHMLFVYSRKTKQWQKVKKRIKNKRDGNWSFVSSKKMGRVHFSPKRGEGGKIVEEWRLLMENNLYLLANFCVYKSKKHYSPRYIYKSNKFYYIPNFWDKVLSEI